MMQPTATKTRAARVLTAALLVSAVLDWNVVPVVHAVKASSSPPEVTLGVTASQIGNGNGKLDSTNEFVSHFEPTVTWSQCGDVGGCDVEAGVTAKASPPSGASFRIFGRVLRPAATGQQALRSWNLRARVETDLSSSADFRPSPVDVALQADGGPSRVTLRALAQLDTAASDSAERSTLAGSLTQLSIEQPFDVWGGTAVVSSRYHVGPQRPEFVVSYGKADTSVTVAGGVDALGDLQPTSVTIRQRLDANREIAPTVSSDGSVEFEYLRRDFGGRGGTATAVYKPDRAVTLGYSEQDWSAKAIIPVEGYYNVAGGAKFMIQRSVEPFQ